MQIFSKIQQLLKITILGGIFKHFLGQKYPPGGELEFSRHIHYDFLKGNHNGRFHTKKFIAAFGRYRLKSPFFSQKGGFWVQNPPGGCPPGGHNNFLGSK